MTLHYVTSMSVSLLFELFNLKQPEVLCFCETWFNETTAFNIPNYTRYLKSRSSKLGGGVAIYARNDIDCLEIIDPLLEAGCEQIWCQKNLNSRRLLVGCMYRPNINTNLAN